MLMRGSDTKLVPSRTVIFRGFTERSELEVFRMKHLSPECVSETYPSGDFTALFAIFFDLRDAMRKVEEEDYGRNIKASYTISKYELPKRGDNCKDKNKQSSINILLKNVHGVDDDDIEKIAAEFGEIYNLRNPKPLQKTVEYYDRRAAVKAYESLNNKYYMGGIIRCRWVWDLAFVVRNRYLDLTREIPPEETQEEDSEAAAPKRQKGNESNNENTLLKIFDECIMENLTEIEKLIRKI